ncbi:hypothetical protein NMY22_g6363 [Coprinellus aureogranulatus]|nr:hypothetical protein NMY22_g6363 [Coprinellus aureogranulatus]
MDDSVDTLRLVYPPTDSPLGRLVNEQRRTLHQISLRRVTRTSLDAWRARFSEELWKNNFLISDAAETLSLSVGLDARVVGAEGVRKSFVEAIYLDGSGQRVELEALLESLQLSILSYMYGEGALVHPVQHALGEDIVESEEMAEIDVSDYEPSVAPQPMEDMGLSREYDRTFAQFCELVDDEEWQKELNGNPELWMPLCQSWVDDLTVGFQEREVRGVPSTVIDLVIPAYNAHVVDRHLEQNIGLGGTLCESHYSAIVSVLRAMRKVKPRTFRSPAWTHCVKASGLARIALSWSDRKAIALWRSPFVIKLLRLHRISLTLLVVLTNWVPRQVVLQEERIPSFRWVVSKPRLSRTEVIAHGRDVIKALVKHPEIIPLDSSPSSAYLFVNQESFVEAWEDFLLYGLQDKGYDVSPLYNQGQLNRELFRQISRAIPDRLIPRNRVHIKDPRLLVILERSEKILNKKHDMAPRGLGGLMGRADRQNLTKPCHRCRNEDPSERCVQDLLVSVKPPQTDLVGCGVSVYPLEEVVKPRGNKKSGKDVKPLLHPINDLGLREIRCNEDVIKRCGVQIFRILDKDTPGPNHVLRDFWVYKAFDDDTFKSLSEHVRRFSHYKGIVRGSQFETFTQGKMCPFGERTPRGGAPGDCHRLYDSMSAATPELVHCLFDNAEDSLVFSILARQVAPEIYSQIEDACDVGERVGTSRSTLYYCRNYAAPLHRDDDVGPGLCATLDFEAERYEYCFINMAYPFYFAPRPGSFWSFRGSDIHGTSLPALRMRGGAAVRVSETEHRAKPRKNAKTAARYRQVRAMQTSLEEFWNDDA